MHRETRTIYITSDGREYSDPQKALDHENALKIFEIIKDLNGTTMERAAVRLIERRSDVMAILLCGTYEE